MRSIRIMVSYADRNAALRAGLLDRLRPNLSCLRDVEIDLWYDRDLYTGDEITPEVIRRIDDCDFGLLLLSAEYFESRYIARYELPRFVGPTADRPSIPVDLGGLVLEDNSRDYRGIERRLIFQHHGRSYRRTPDRYDFATELATQIHRRILSGR
jgi:TIR domain